MSPDLGQPDRWTPDHLTACPSCGDLWGKVEKWCPSCDTWMMLRGPTATELHVHAMLSRKGTEA